MLEDAAEVDATGEAESQITGAGGPVAGLVGNIILHTGPHVDFELARIYRTPEPLVKLASVFSIGISEGVVNVLCVSDNKARMIPRINGGRRDPYLLRTVDS